MESKNNKDEKSAPGTAASDDEGTNPDDERDGSPREETPMETEEELIARGKKILDDPDTPQKTTSNTTPKARHDSIGITNLELKMKMMAKDYIGEKMSGSASHRDTAVSDDDSAFSKTEKASGVPTIEKLKNTGHIHSESGRKRTVSVSSSAKSDSGKASTREHKFPPAYYNVRKLRANSHPYVELPSITGDQRSDFNPSKNLPGFETADDDRQYEVKNFHVPAYKKNVREGAEVFCVTCTKQHRFDGAEPICLILTDQNFPPKLPTDKESCCVIIRLEDCFLSDLPGILKEFFGNRPKFLPEGSLVLYGSLSQLAKRGVEHYAEECVKYQKVLTNMIPNTCSVTHVVFVPLGGIDTPGLIRDLYDLDCWLRRSVPISAASLPEARRKLWQILTESGSGSATGTNRTIFVPESLHSGTKIRTISAPPNPPPFLKKSHHSVLKTNWY
jgi:hypothetical protein